MFERRRTVSLARYRFPGIFGWTINILSVLWVAFELILFSMPVALPVDLTTMNWASLVFAGFMFLSIIYYVVRARKCKCDQRKALKGANNGSLDYVGPPKSDGL